MSSHHPMHALLLGSLSLLNAASAQTSLAQTTRPLLQSPALTSPSKLAQPVGVNPAALQLRPVFVPGTQPLRKTSRGTDSYQAAGSAGPLVCSRETFNVATAPIEYAMYSLDGDKMWVGSLVQSAGLQDGLGSLRTVNIPESRRQPYRITTALPITGGSATIDPNLSSYNGALATLRQKLNGTPYGSSVRYEVTEQSSADTSAMMLGLNASYLTAKVSMSASATSTNKMNTVTAAFVQNAFTVNADLGGNTARNAFLNNPTPEDLAALDGAAYVDSITYGRLLMVTMTSSYSSNEMKLALQAAYSSGFASVDGSFSMDTKKVLQSSSFKVYSNGGDDQAVIDLIRTQQLGSYFQKPAKPTTLVPVSFTARNVDSGLYAAYNTTGKYAVTVCNNASVKAWMTVYYKSIEPNDSKYDDIFGQLSQDGRVIWNVPEDRHFDLYKGSTFTVFKSADPLVLNFGEPRTTRITGTIMDHDVGPNDVVGNFNDLIDLNAVAEEFRANPSQTVVRREIRRHGEDDADGVMIIEFSRQN